MTTPMAFEGQGNNERIKSTIEKWHTGVRNRDPDMLLSMFAKDVTLSTPFLKTPFQGATELLTTMKSFIGAVEGFRYLDTMYDGDKACLFFEGHIKGEHLQGVDVFSIDEQGKIVSIEVMARSLPAIQHLHDVVTSKSS